MEFEGQYLTYEEYRLLGGTLDLTPFNLLEFEARRIIDIRTQNRLKNLEYSEIPQEIKLCIYSLINTVNAYQETLEKAQSNNITSENTDGYSVSYLNPSSITDIIKSNGTEIDYIIRTYLTNVIVNNEHILFLGVR